MQTRNAVRPEKWRLTLKKRHLNQKHVEVIVNGKAYVTEVSVEEQRHYLEDAGKSAEEIAAITEPKKTYSFEADGVLLIEE